MFTVRIDKINETKHLRRELKKTRNLGKQTVYHKYIKIMTVCQIFIRIGLVYQLLRILTHRRIAQCHKYRFHYTALHNIHRNTFYMDVQYRLQQNTMKGTFNLARDFMFLYVKYIFNIKTINQSVQYDNLA